MRLRLSSLAVIVAATVAVIVPVTVGAGCSGPVEADATAGSALISRRPLADFVGISSGGVSDDLLARIDALGLHRLRTDFDWQAIEPARGTWRWSHYDEVVQQAGAHGIALLGILDYGAAWANPVVYRASGDAAAPPDRLVDFADFARAVTARYPTVTAFEIWNEPNNGGRFWHSAPHAGTPTTVDFAPRATTGLYGDPGLFAHLVATTMTAVREGGGAPLLAPGGTIFLWEPPVAVAGNNSGPDFMKAAFAAVPGLAAASDAVTLHGYEAYPPDAPPESEAWEWGTLNVQLGDKIAHMTATFRAAGQPARPVWLTEIGWPNRNGVDEAKQARWLVRSIVLAALDGADLVYLYTLYDSAKNDDSGAFDLAPEAYFGLVRVDGTPKLSYVALQRLMALLGGHHVVARVPANDPQNAGYIVRLVDGGGRPAWIAWDSLEPGWLGAPSFRWTLPPNTSCIRLDGGGCTIASGQVIVDATPVYVIAR
jgi:hypothetical protein